MHRQLFSIACLLWTSPAQAQTVENNTAEWIAAALVYVLLAFVALRLVQNGSLRNFALAIAAGIIKARRRLTSSWNEFVRQARHRVDK